MGRRKTINMPKKGTQARVKREPFKKVKLVLKGAEIVASPSTSSEEEQASESEDEVPYEEYLEREVSYLVYGAIESVKKQARDRYRAAFWAQPLESRLARDKDEYINVYETLMWDRYGAHGAGLKFVRDRVALEYDAAMLRGPPSLPLHRLSHKGRVQLSHLVCSCGALHWIPKYVHCDGVPTSDLSLFKKA